ncbi:hypothetical protein FRB95_002325 [Tulasnella sp. JGI-2019a]|nr:hypothetical protein FRB95_002325 [Tulasnella sp. JGI-2019a]
MGTSPQPSTQLDILPCLPIELWVAIFRHVLDDPRHPDIYYKRLSQIGRVCRAWREIVKSSPELWTLVTSHTRNIDQCLKSSKHAGLTVILRAGTFTARGTIKDWQKILSNIPRWRTANIVLAARAETRESYASLLRDSLENSSAPLLTSLCLHQEDIGNGRHILDPFRGTAPRLRELALESACLRNWASPFLFHLTVISLKRICRDGPSLSQLLEVLDTCVDLETLHLEDCIIDCTDPYPPARSIRLSRLSKLFISQVPPITSECLLSGIQAPLCRNFSTSGVGQGPEHVRRCCDFITPSFRRFLRSARTIEIMARAEGTNVDGKGVDQHEGFSIRMNKSSLTSVWPAFILPLFETSLLPTLQLSLHLVEPNDLPDDHCGELHGVTKVTGGGQKLLHQLAIVPVVGEDSRWKWPDLRDVELDSVMGLKVLEMVEARAKATAVVNERDGGQHGPMAFERLILGEQCFISSRTLRKVRDIVGEGMEWLPECAEDAAAIGETL